MPPFASKTLGWVLGRGVARAFGFSWRVPDDDYAAFRAGALSRGQLVDRIRAALGTRQADATLDELRVGRFARALPRRCTHIVATTNWNTLLDRALEQHGVRVLHLNGSLDDTEGPLLTELDRRDDAVQPPLAALASAHACVLAGLSVESELDRDLLAQLGAIREWYVVNPDERAAHRICAMLPGRSTLIPVAFERWVDAGLPGLEQGG